MGIVSSVLLFNLLVLITHTVKIADSAIFRSKTGVVKQPEISKCPK